MQGKNILKALIPAILAAGVGGTGGYLYANRKANMGLKSSNVEKEKIAKYFYLLGQQNMYQRLLPK